jgi:hypothetical protein
LELGKTETGSSTFVAPIAITAQLSLKRQGGASRLQQPGDFGKRREELLSVWMGNGRCAVRAQAGSITRVMEFSGLRRYRFFWRESRKIEP